MRQRRLLPALLVTVGCLFHLNDAFVYRIPRIQGLNKGSVVPRSENVLLHLSPTESDSSEALSADSAQMTMDQYSSTGEEQFFASEAIDVDTFLGSSSTDVPPDLMPNKIRDKDDKESMLLTRRAWLQTGVLLFSEIVVAAATILHERAESTNQPTANTFQLSTSPLATANSTATKTNEESRTMGTAKVGPIKKLQPVNIAQVVAETNVNITLDCPDACVFIDSTTMTKVQNKKVPTWVPSWLAPRPKVIKQISNAELLVAAIIAGSVVDMGRTSLLYPIQTVKTRIQTDVNNGTRAAPPMQERIQAFGVHVKRHINEGNLYAGMTPTLLVSVPATGIYFGVRDVSKKVLTMTPLNGIEVALLAALIGDVVSLCFRAPTDALTIRLQNLDDDVGDWFGDSIKKLPSIIITDLPYLLSKISLNRLLIHGSISIDHYLVFAILASSIAALWTTPFDVARTRILVDSDGNFSNGIDGGSGDGVIKTMQGIIQEGNGGYSNLFAGWFERVLYLGVGRAWLEPIQLIGYVGIRDAVLLEWF